MLKNAKGFTLVEIIVVLAILGILAGAAVPATLGYISDSKEKVCLSNRATMERLYKHYSMLYPGDHTLKDAVDGKIEFLKNDFAAFKCPSGGTLSASGDHVTCSVHAPGDHPDTPDPDTGGGAPDPEPGSGTPDPGSGGTPDPGNGGTTPPAQTRIIFNTVIVADPFKLYEDILNKNDNGRILTTGMVFGFGNDIYMSKEGPYMSLSDARFFKENPSSRPSQMLKIDITKKLYTPAEYLEIPGKGNWNGNGNQAVPSLYDFYKDTKGQIWILYYGSGIYVNQPLSKKAITEPETQGSWIKLVSGQQFAF